MDKQNNSNLDALLNNLIENFGEDDPVTQKVESLMEENVNLLLVGATGSGKSSTINAMFNMQVAKVGVGVDPETACIEKYELGGLTIWDTPGLGDGVERDIEIAVHQRTKIAADDRIERHHIETGFLKRLACALSGSDRNIPLTACTAGKQGNVDILRVNCSTHEGPFSLLV